MVAEKQHIDRFRKTLKRFLEKKNSGELNGKAAIVEDKLKAAASEVGLSFDEELKKLLNGSGSRETIVIGHSEKGFTREEIEALINTIEVIQDDEEIRENRAPKPDELYQMITDQLVELIESDKQLPWQMPWNVGRKFPHGAPTNFVSKKPYRGINSVLLAFTKLVYDEEGNKKRVVPGFNNPYYMTFNQIEQKGGTLKEGAVGQYAFYFRLLYRYEQEDPNLYFSTFDRDEFIEWVKENENEIERLAGQSPEGFADNSLIPILRYYNIYNGEDIEGIDFGELEQPEGLKEEDRLEHAEKIFENYPNPPGLKHGGNRAAYIPKMDEIVMPEFKTFKDPQRYYSVLYHESAHSTGHSKRLNRGNDTRARDGSDEDKKAYNFEELVAEMSAAFLCGEVGILFHTRENSAAYLRAYRNALLEFMDDDNKFFFRAASRAQAAADHILDRDENGIPAYLKDSSTKAAKEEPEVEPDPEVEEAEQPEKEPAIEAVGIRGNETTVDFKADGSESKKGTYALIEKRDLVASHNKDCSSNSKHRISRGQPRDRSLDNLCAQPKFIAKNLNPGSITQGNLAFQGAPVTLPDGMVIQGNGRSISLHIAYDEIPAKAKAYKDYLAANASQYGFKKSDVTGMDEPVLVRILDVDDKEAIRLGNIVDTSQAKMSRIDQAKAIIRNLTPQKLEAIGRIIASSNGETMGAIIDDIGIRIFDQVKDLDRTGLIEKNELTSDGKEFLRSVLTGIIFDSEKYKSALRDFLDNPHTIQAGIERSFGNIIPLINQKGDIREQVQEAVQITAEIKRNDAFDSVEDVMSSVDMFSGQKNYSEQGQDLARFLNSVKTQKEIRDAFRVYVAHIKGKDDLFNPIEATSQKNAFEAAFVKRENPPEHLVKLKTPAAFKKGDIIRDYYEDQKYWIEKIQGKKVHAKSLETGKKVVFSANDKRFLPNRLETPTLSLFPDHRKNFTIRLTPKVSNKATKRFDKEASDFEKAVVRAMVNDENYSKFTEDMSEERRKKFYQNLSFRLSQFQGAKNDPLWFKYINRPLSEFAEAIKREAKKLYKSDEEVRENSARRQQKRTDIRLVKPKAQFETVEEAWESVHETTGLNSNQVRPAHTKKSWKWEEISRKNPTPKGGADIRLVKPKSQFETETDAWESVVETTGVEPMDVIPSHTKKAWTWKRIDELRDNPGARFVMLGVCKEIVIDNGENGYKKLEGPLAMFTNKAKDKLLIVQFSALKEAPFDVKDKKAEQIYKEWHNYPADERNFLLKWPENSKPIPVGFAVSILYASDKIMQPQDKKGKVNIYEHDFDAGKRPCSVKGEILIVSNLKIDERGILN